jgi:hypothetical protein
MSIAPNSPDLDLPAQWVPGLSGHSLARRPDFLVVSAPKTGSTWLADNLRAHPELYVPEVKELKFFSSLYQSVDLGWYLDQFAPGVGRVKGEASPSYALLPVARIRAIRRLCPNLKIVFLLREPVGRAWSHARHTHRYREATFANGAVELADVTYDEWRANCAHDWVAASGDYLGQLRRWIAVFPPEQVYVGFYESLETQPAELLRDVFEFLGVDPGVELSRFPVYDRVLVGQPHPLPSELRAFLHSQWHARTAELAAFLREYFSVDPPHAWRDILCAPAEPSGRLVATERADDDAYLARVLQTEDAFPLVPARVMPAFHGYDIVFSRGRLFAVSRALGPTELPLGIQGADQATTARLLATGACFTAPTLAELKERVAGSVAERSAAHVRELETELAQVRERAQAALETGRNCVRRLAVIEAEAVRMTQGELVAIERVRRTIQRVLRAGRRVLSLGRSGRRTEALPSPGPAV